MVAHGSRPNEATNSIKVQVHGLRDIHHFPVYLFLSQFQSACMHTCNAGVFENVKQAFVCETPVL